MFDAGICPGDEVGVLIQDFFVLFIVSVVLNWLGVVCVFYDFLCGKACLVKMILVHVVDCVIVDVVGCVFLDEVLFEVDVEC